MESRERVAFLGLGIMGFPMAANLVRGGFDVVAWNRTSERAEEFARRHGTRTAESPAAAAAEADVTITMVPDVPEVEEVLFGENGAAEGMSEGKLAIDMSTIAPGASVSVGERLRANGIAFVDAPVSGSRPKAEDGSLTIMVGGERADFERARPLLEAMGELVLHAGPLGHGSLVKLVNNTLAAVNAAALAEAIAFARAEGIDTDVMTRAVGAGSGASRMLELKVAPMLAGDYEPLFKLEHMLKDVRHYLAEAERTGAPARLGSVAERLYAAAAEKGLGERDFAAVIESVDGPAP
jgi:3-hydroxyisobutyrate dehydrogenase-like beta-hydroxyacid dehydrogenase